MVTGRKELPLLQSDEKKRKNKNPSRRRANNRFSEGETTHRDGRGMGMSGKVTDRIAVTLQQQGGKLPGACPAPGEQRHFRNTQQNQTNARP